MIKSFLESQHNRITRKRIYISGPLTSSGDPEENVNVAMDLTKDLIELGYAPLCPHLSWFIDPEVKIKHSVWISVDIAWLQMSECVYRLPGSSSGADQECREAVNRGIPIAKSVQELLEKCPP